MSLEFKIVKLNNKTHDAVCEKINSLKIINISSDIEIIRYKKSIDINYFFDFDEYEESKDSIDKKVDQLFEVQTDLSKELSLSIKYSLQRSEYEDLMICSIINGEDFDGTPEDILWRQKIKKQFRESKFSPFIIEAKEGSKNIEEIFSLFSDRRSLELIIELLEHLESEESYKFNDYYLHPLDKCESSYQSSTSIEISVSAGFFNFKIQTDWISEEAESKSLALMQKLTVDKPKENKRSRSFLLNNYHVNFNMYGDSEFNIGISEYFTELNYDMSLQEFGQFLISVKTEDSYDQDTVNMLEEMIKEFMMKDSEIWEYRLGLFYMQLSRRYSFPKRSAFNLFDKLSESGNLTAQLICANTCYGARKEYPDLYKKTEHYLTLASNQGDESANKNLARFKKYRELTNILTKPLW